MKKRNPIDDLVYNSRWLVMLVVAQAVLWAILGYVLSRVTK